MSSLAAIAKTAYTAVTTPSVTLGAATTVALPHTGTIIMATRSRLAVGATATRDAPLGSPLATSAAATGGASTLAMGASSITVATTPLGARGPGRVGLSRAGLGRMGLGPVGLSPLLGLGPVGLSPLLGPGPVGLSPAGLDPVGGAPPPKIHPRACCWARRTGVPHGGRHRGGGMLAAATVATSARGPG